MGFQWGRAAADGRARRRQGLMARLKLSASRFAAPRPARASKLVFDPLEPRLLLSADPLVLDLPALNPSHPENDLLVRVIEETRVVNDTPTVKQQVQVVDRTDPTHILAAADLDDDITRISILGGPGADRVTI